ncbi:MAG: glycogen debranching enzyme GlgX, partial [Rhodoferax sp.]|nr:glycogen debranching enzyme GlgX [Rhodoferax sp.]
PTDDPAINERRARVRRAMMATLLLAQGTPMLCAGDEFGNSQQGNNNAYCQDNATGWLDWPHAQRDFTAFVAQLTELRRVEPLLRRADWLAPSFSVATDSVAWLRADGAAMGVDDWHGVQQSALACLLSASTATGDSQGAPRLLLLFNPASRPTAFSLPKGRWQVALDSSTATDVASMAVDTLLLSPHTLMVLRCTPT